MNLIVLFQLTFIFIYNIFNKKINFNKINRFQTEINFLTKFLKAKYGK